MKKDKMFRVFMIFLILLLVGCRSHSTDVLEFDSQNPIMITIWHPYYGAQKLAFDEMVTEFNETEGYKKGIFVETVGHVNMNELVSNIMNSIKKKVGAAELPDLFSAYADTAYYMDQLGLLASLDDYMTEEEIQEYIDAYIEEGRSLTGSKLKIFPIAKSTEIMMMNKTDWEPFAIETGAKLEDLTTWEGIVKTAKAYYDWSGGKAFFGRDAMANYMLVGSKQLGQEIFEVKNGQVQVQVHDDVMRKLWDCFYVPYVKGYYTAVGPFRSDDVKTGDIIAFVGSTSSMTYFPNKVVVDDQKSYPIESMVLPLPNFEGTLPHAVQQGAGMVVVKSDLLKERASTEFLKWFTETERNVQFSMRSAYLPVKKVANDLNLIQDQLQFCKEGDLKTPLCGALPLIFDQMKNSELYTSPVFSKGTSAREILDNALLTKAKTDHKIILQRMAQGQSREEAMETFLADENFEQWLLELKISLQVLLQ